MKQLPDQSITISPSDLVNYQNCQHLIAQDLSALKGGPQRPVRQSAIVEVLRERGLAHEVAYLAHLRQQGVDVAVKAAPDANSPPGAHSADQTLRLMQAGQEAIYQATLTDGELTGIADFLIRVDKPSALGEWSYQAIDTKLAQETRVATVIQLCAYSELLSKLQGSEPPAMGVVPPGERFDTVWYRTADFSAYYQMLRARLNDFMHSPTATYPEPVQHCDVCVWWTHCDKRRRADDHLGFVAGIQSAQVTSLRDVPITTMTQLADAGELDRPRHGSLQALQTVQRQAKVQRQGMVSGEPVIEMRQPINAEHGLALLPAPTADDIYLDFEGDHFASEHSVQEYLTGWVQRDASGKLQYTPLRATTRAQEKKNFEAFIDVASAVRQRNLNAHIYHFAPYEPAALKRLMGRYATREQALDELLRGGAFVDLLKVVKRSLFASVESYSIKELERFFGFSREQDVREAAKSRRVIELVLPAPSLDPRLQSDIDRVEAYNREDCESLVLLQQWLERLRAEQIAVGETIERPALADSTSSEKINELDQKLEALRDGLLQGIPDDPAERSDEQQQRFILAHLMQFHRREAKAAWWEYFRLRDLEPGDLVSERRAVGGLNFVEALPVKPKAVPIHRYQFPEQEIDLRPGDGLRYRIESPEARSDALPDSSGSNKSEIKSGDRPSDTWGTVQAVDLINRTVDVKKQRKTAKIHADNAFALNIVPDDVIRDALNRFGKHVLENGFGIEGRFSVAEQLLLRKPPTSNHVNADLQGPSEATVDCACRIAIELASSKAGGILAIQGPPGAGKTYTGANVICALVKAGLKVGVCAVSHRVILNLIEAGCKLAGDKGRTIKAGHRQKTGERYAGDYDVADLADNSDLYDAVADGGCQLVGATAFAWAREEFSEHGPILDVLMVDEAGQMALANALAIAPACRALVLLGDPQQLEQPLQARHPEGSEVSALSHWLGGTPTMPSDMGLFLEKTWRLHPEICRFTSEMYYEGRLSSVDRLENQTIRPRSGQKLPISGSGLRYVPVEHTGNSSRSSEEVEKVAELVSSLMKNGQYQEEDETLRNIQADDILIISPYNAQVIALQASLPNLASRIGTVDKFQGQEAAVVLYSMASSSLAEAPRGATFLLDRFRFNVATSRARALCVLIAGSRMVDELAASVEAVRLMNGWVRYLALAES